MEYMRLISSTMPRAIFIGIICFCVYLTTVAPDVGFTDSGELAAVCTTLGVAHPTGYPLYTLLGHIWTLLPLPFAPITSLNIFAALCVAISAGVFSWCVTLVLRIISQPKISTPKGKQSPGITSFTAMTEYTAIIVSSMMYAFTGIIWDQATGNEVYSLQLIIFSLTIGLFLHAVSVKQEKRLYMLMLWSLVLGLGFGNHGTTILLAPAMLFMYFKRPFETFTVSSERWREILILTIPFIAGLCVWVYLPLRSAALPEFNWGEVHRSFEKFWYHASGKQFQIWMFNGSFSQNSKEFFSLLPSQFAYIGLPCIIVGMIQIFKRNITLFFFTILLFFGCVFYAFNYGIHDIEPYFSLAVLALYLFCAVGFAHIVTRIHARIQSGVSIVGSAIVCLSLQIFIHYKDVDKSNDTAVRDYTKLMVEKLPKDAVIISSQWDYWCSAFWYKQSCEQMRPDIILIEKELLRRTWYPRHLRRKYPALFEALQKEMDTFERELELFESGGQYSDMRLQMAWEKMLHSLLLVHYEKRPLYLTHDVLQSEQAMMRGFKPIPSGLSYRIVKANDTNIYPISVPDYTSLARIVNRYDGHLYTGMKQVVATSLQSMLYYAQKIENNPSKAQKAQDQLRYFTTEN